MDANTEACVNKYVPLLRQKHMQPLLDAAVDDRAAAAEHERDAGVGSYSSELSFPSELSSVASPASEA